MKLTGALLCLVIGFAAVKAFSVSGRATFEATRPSGGVPIDIPWLPGPQVFRNLFGAERQRTTTTKNPNHPSSSTHGPSSPGSSTDRPTSSHPPSSHGPSSSTSVHGSSTHRPTSSGSSTHRPTSSGSSTPRPTSSRPSTPRPTSSRPSTPRLSTTPSSPSNNPAMGLQIPNLMNMFNVPSADSFFSPNNVPSVPSIPGVGNLENLQIPGVDEAIQEAREHVTEALSLGANFSISLDQAVQDALASSDPSAALRTLAQAVLDAYVTAAANCPLIVVGIRVLQEGIRLAGEIARSAENIILGTTVSTTTVTTTTTPAN